MKSTELFVEQTLTGFLVLSAAAAPFVGVEIVQKVSDEATGGLDIGETAGRSAPLICSASSSTASPIRCWNASIGGTGCCSPSNSGRRTKGCRRTTRFPKTGCKSR